MIINRAVNEISKSDQLEARDIMDWEDKDDQNKTWVYCQSYFKTLWTQKTRYGSGSPRKHGFAESAAKVSDELTETSEEHLSINIHEMAIAATADN